jgi:hypothetical protein
MLTKIRERTQDAPLLAETSMREANLRNLAEAIACAIFISQAIFTTLVAMTGAVLVTLVAGFVNGRTMYARQL